MIVIVTQYDIWKEFIYWRTNGNKEIAFDYLRNNMQTSRWEALIASLVKHNYPSISPGDKIIVKNSIEFNWDNELEALFTMSS